MTDHPLFPEMQDEQPTAQPTDTEPVKAPAAAESYLTEERVVPTPEPIEEERPEEAFAPQEPKPFVAQQAPFMPRPPMQNGYAPYTVPQQPIRQNFDPYTGKPYRPEPPKPIPPVKPKKEKKSNGLGWRLAVFGLCVALVGGVIGGFLGFALAPNDRGDYDERLEREPVTDALQPTEPTSSTLQKPAGNMEPPANLSALYEAAVPTIVGIHNEFTTYNYFGQGSTSSSTGTGFIISADGEILTNYHVVESAENLTVTMYDGTEYAAEVLGYEAESDVALIKVDATDLPVVTMGDSDALMVGEQITAIGNPLGELTHTMTVGYVSAKSRAVYTDEKPINMMQIDAAINPGNSGGPLFNLNGEVVGITTAKYSGTLDGSATIEGIGFAIPINDVLAIVDDLREYGSVQNRAYMGVTVTNGVAGGDLPAGALIQSIEKNGPGAKAGLRLNDIITAVGNTKVYGVDTLYQALRPYRGGDSAELTVFRSGETVKLTITFGTAPETEEPEEIPTETEPVTEDFGFPWDFFFP